MEKKNSSRESGSITYNFKITVVILLFFLSGLRLFSYYFFPGAEIVSDRIFLFIVFFIVFYLWIQESLDFSKLKETNTLLKEAHEDLKQSEIDIIASLIRTVEAKDPYTSGHSERVTKIAMAIAEEMKLDGHTKAVISRAGMLHDIGKIGISDAILNKKEKLTDEEWSIIKSHPTQSFKILEPLKFLSDERCAVLHHHERYDGKGYPEGLEGENIALEARVLAVADAFDAMNSRRSYRNALTKEMIICELNKARGTQHSPLIVDTFLKLLDKKPELWEKEEYF